MKRIIQINCLVFAIILLNFESVNTYNSNEYELDERHDKDNSMANLWFGPRLGRKKKNFIDDDNHYNINNLKMDKEITPLLELLKNYPWSYIILHENKRQHTPNNFTPRLGRETNTNTNNEKYLRDPNIIREDQISARSPPFAPRLGRHMSRYSPRLGRTSERNFPSEYL